jgi:hypothetical protein
MFLQTLLWNDYSLVMIFRAIMRTIFLGPVRYDIDVPSVTATYNDAINNLSIFFVSRRCISNKWYVTSNILWNEDSLVMIFRAIWKVSEHRDCSCPLCVPSVTSSILDQILDWNGLEYKILWFVIVVECFLQDYYNHRVLNSVYCSAQYVYFLVVIVCLLCLSPKRSITSSITCKGEFNNM